MSKRVEAQTGDITLTAIAGNLVIDGLGTIKIAEQAAASTDEAGFGQLWVRDDAPNKLMFTDDAGTDFIVNIPSGTAEGNMLYWDSAAGNYAETSNVNYDSVNTALSIGTNLTIEDQGGTPGTSGITQFKNGVGTVAFDITDTDGSNVIFQNYGIRMSPDGGGISQTIAMWGTGSRNEIKTLADGELNFSAENASATPRAYFSYPIGIANTSQNPPTTKASTMQLWSSSEGAFGNALFVQTDNGNNSPIGVITSVHYAFNNPTAAADPSQPFMRLNNASFASVTEAYFNDEDLTSLDQGWWFGRMAVGDVILMSQGSDKTRWCEARVDSITDNTGWWTLGVTPLDHAGTTFGNGEDVRVDLLRASIAATASSSVSVTGTPVDNQLAVWTDENTIEGDANLTWTGTTLAIAGAGAQLLLPQELDAATPTLAFGDGDTGLYESADDTLWISIEGADGFRFNSTSLLANATNGPALRRVTPTATAPSIVPNINNNTTGLGTAATDQLSLIAGGVEVMRLVEDTEDYILANTPVLISQSAAAVADVADYGQLWVRSDAPNTLMYTDDTGLDFTANNVLEIEYAYSNATASADPGAGTVRFNSLTIGSITEMYIDDLDNTGRDNSIMLANLAVGDVITFRSATDPADYFIATVDAATTDNTGWWTVPVAPVHTGTIFTNGDLMRVSVEWQSQAIAASGTVLSTGSPSDNQVAVWTATADTLEGDANFTWTGTTLAIAGAGAQLLLPQELDAATPTLAFGDGDTGFYESADDALRIAVFGAERWQIDGSFLGSATTGAGFLTQAAASGTAPAHTFKGDTDTGIGTAAADQLSLIAGGVEMLRAVETGVATTDQVTIAPGATLRGAPATPSLAFGDGDTGFYESLDDRLNLVLSGGIRTQWQDTFVQFGANTTRAGIYTDAATSTNPVFTPNLGDSDTGIGWAAADQLSLVTGGVESKRLTAATVTTDTVNTIAAQDETFYDNSPTSEGTFAGGTGYAAAEVITLSDGSTVTVDAVSGGVVTQFTVTTASTTPFTLGATLTTVSSTGAGNNDFTLTPDTDNVTAAAEEIISIPVASGTTFGYRINIVGTESATGDTVFESIFGAIRNQGGTTAIVGSDIVDRTEDAGAAGWVVTVAADDTTDALTVDVTGQVSKTIDWKVSVEILEV